MPPPVDPTTEAFTAAQTALDMLTVPEHITVVVQWHATDCDCGSGQHGPRPQWRIAATTVCAAAVHPGPDTRTHGLWISFDPAPDQFEGHVRAVAATAVDAVTRLVARDHALTTAAN